MRTRTEILLTDVVLMVGLMLAVAPVLGIVLVALQAQGTFGGSIASLTNLTVDNFVQAWDKGAFGMSLRSSAIVVSFAVPIATLLSILAGYAIAVMRFPGRALLFGVFVFALMIPIEATMIPLFYTWQAIGLTDSYWAIIFTEIGYHMPFGVFWMAASFRSVPRELVESARIDGADTWQVLWRVAIPVTRPAILTLLALQFMWVWNNFLMPLVMLNSEDKRTAPMSISYFQGQYVADLTLIAAACVIVAAPVVIAYIFLQRQFISGMVSGALKG